MRVPERQLRNHAPLASVSAVEVAQIAATLLGEGCDEVEAIRQTYRLLDIAEHCRLSLANDACVEAGLKAYKEGVAADDEFYAGLAALPQYNHSYDEAGNKLPVPFLEGLAILMRNVKKDVREERFHQYAMQYYREAFPEKDEQTLMIEVGKRFADFKNAGIPAELFGKATIFFPGWWESAKSATKSASGTKGQAKKQANAAQEAPKPKRGRKKNPE